MLSDQQEKTAQYFQKAVSADTLRHAYIIEGEQGIGKKTLCKTILQTIVCKHKSACGKCNSCQSAAAGANPDIVRVSNDGKQTIEIKKIRAMIQEVYTKPILGRYKVFVIENAHLMNAEPQNALLKVIEEPPEYAVFLLLCDNSRFLLPTILSRSMLLRLTPESMEDLEKMCPLPEESSFLYHYCMGNIGRLLAIREDEDFIALREQTIHSFLELAEGDSYKVYDCVEFWTQHKDGKDTMLSVLTLLLRDVLLYKKDLEAMTVNKDKSKEIKALSDRISFKSCFQMLETVNETPKLLGKYGNFNMAVQTMLIRLKEEING